MSGFSFAKSGEEFSWVGGARVVFKEHAYTMTGRERWTVFSTVVAFESNEDRSMVLFDVPRLDRVIYGKDWILAWAYPELRSWYEVYLVVRKPDGSYMRREAEVLGCKGTLVVGIPEVDDLGNLVHITVTVDSGSSSPMTVWDDYGPLLVMRWSAGQSEAA